ncbi:hypothetical protein [Streptomyces sp. NPDC004284]|uniref:hypothetical protein n=1 Tax=Streptomyces sp. NPDC004284 TaxID=3364695 RepID=UPI003677C9AC
MLVLALLRLPAARPVGIALDVVTALVLVPGHWYDCRHSSVDPRRARLALEHCPWRRFLRDSPPWPAGERERRAGWEGPRFGGGVSTPGGGHPALLERRDLPGNRPLRHRRDA